MKKRRKLPLLIQLQIQLLVTSISVIQLLGYRNKICHLSSFCRDSPVADLLTKWKKHQNIAGKSQQLMQVDGILLFSILETSGSYKQYIQGEREEEREGGCHSHDCCNWEVCPQGLLIWDFAHSVTVYQQLFARLRALWLCNFAWFWQIFLALCLHMIIREVVYNSKTSS